MESDSSDSASDISSGVSVLELSDDKTVDLIDFERQDLKQGTFVLVEFKGGARLATKYRYALCKGLLMMMKL